MILKNYYYFFIKGIPDKTCDAIIKKFYSKKLDKGTIKGGSIKVRNSDVMFSDDPELYDIINPFIHQANKEAGWNFQWDFTESFQFTKYKLNQYYNWHQDSSPECYPDDHRYVNYRGKYRKLSAVVALSDDSEYKGGEFQMDFRDKTMKDKKEIKDVRRIVTIKELRQKGTVIVFPSFMWHRVKPVISGTRYSLVSWSLGAPFK
tara:strand:+ start:210 stop:821 length:612 start_codon:yes stop_codon:yes gene_type:complete